jgi:putative ABC transport system permease protein
VIGRLRPGVTLAQFRARSKVLDAQYGPESTGNSDVTADYLQRTLFANVRNTVLVLWGAVACLLVIACANVANLVLARAAARYRDLSVCLALGASHWRIAQQLLIESVFLCLCSVLLSLPLSVWGMRWLTVALQQTSRVIPEAHLDLRVLLFTLGVAGSIGTALGLTPMWILRRSAVLAGLHSGGRGFSASKWSTRLRGGTVAAQVAFCLALLAGAGLLMQSFIRMYTMSTGMRTDHVAMFPLDLMPDRYESWDKRAHFYDDVLQRVETIPGVKAAGIASRVDLVSHGLGYRIRVEGNTDAALQDAGTRGRSVSPNYFRVLGIPLLRGRMFEERDTTHSKRVAIVNEAFANKFFPGMDPVGRHVTYSTDQLQCEIVGLVSNVRAGLQETGVEDGLYLPLSQRPWLVAKLLVRFEHSQRIAEAIRERVQSADPAQAVAESIPLEQVISDNLGRPRTTMLLVAMFAGSALFLVGIGIYGVIAYSVAQRRKEIGIRMALGADGGRVRALLFRQTFRMLGIGFALGLPLAAMLNRLYASLLFEVKPGDPYTFLCALGVLIAVAWLATYLPAVRASKTDPLIVLRTE